MITEVQISQRELEQLELNGSHAQRAVDQVDEKWPEISAAAALAADCYEALKNNNFTEEQALKLVPAMLAYLR